jgi:CheY-like chemotaxis protein/signal transduction histidine kinase
MKASSTTPLQLPHVADSSLRKFSPFLLSFSDHQQQIDYQYFKQRNSITSPPLLGSLFLLCLSFYYVLELILLLTEQQHSSHHRRPDPFLKTTLVVILSFALLSTLSGWFLILKSLCFNTQQQQSKRKQQQLLRLLHRLSFSFLSNLFVLSISFFSFMILILKSQLSFSLSSSSSSSPLFSFQYPSLLSFDLILYPLLLPLLLQSLFRSSNFSSLLLSWCGSVISLTITLFTLSPSPASSSSSSSLLLLFYLLLLFTALSLYQNEYLLLSHFTDTLDRDNSNFIHFTSNTTARVDLEKQHIEKVIGSIAHDLRTPMQSLQLDLNSLIEMILSPQSQHSQPPPSTNVTTVATTSQPTQSTQQPQQTASNNGGGVPTSTSTPSIGSITYAAPDVHEMVTIIEDLHDTLHFMFASVNRGVDYCKIDSGTPLLHSREIVDYHLCVTNAVALVSRSIAHGTKINHQIRHYDSRNKFLNTDKSWLFESLVCLISNAVKYSAGGDVLVRVECHENPSFVSFTVENNSFESILKEMNVQDPMAVFQDFSVSSRTSGGAGLGLYILGTRIKILGGEYGCEITRRQEAEEPQQHREQESVAVSHSEESAVDGKCGVGGQSDPGVGGKGPSGGFGSSTGATDRVSAAAGAGGGGGTGGASYLTRFWFHLPIHSLYGSEKKRDQDSNTSRENDVRSERSGRRFERTENFRLQNFLLPPPRVGTSNRDDDDSNSLISIRTLDFSRLGGVEPFTNGSEPSTRKYSILSAPVTVYEEEYEHDHDHDQDQAEGGGTGSRRAYLEQTKTEKQHRNFLTTEGEVEDRRGGENPGKKNYERVVREDSTVLVTSTTNADVEGLAGGQVAGAGESKEMSLQSTDLSRQQELFALTDFENSDPPQQPPHNNRPTPNMSASPLPLRLHGTPSLKSTTSPPPRSQHSLQDHLDHRRKSESKVHLLRSRYWKLNRKVHSANDLNAAAAAATTEGEDYETHSDGPGGEEKGSDGGNWSVGGGSFGGGGSCVGVGGDDGDDTSHSGSVITSVSLQKQLSMILSQEDVTHEAVTEDNPTHHLNTPAASVAPRHRSLTIAPVLSAPPPSSTLASVSASVAVAVAAPSPLGVTTGHSRDGLGISTSPGGGWVQSHPTPLLFLNTNDQQFAVSSSAPSPSSSSMFSPKTSNSLRRPHVTGRDEEVHASTSFSSLPALPSSSSSSTILPSSTVLNSISHPALGYSVSSLSSSRPPPSTRTILVVDDSTVIQKSTKRSLQRVGYEVELADNGLNALTMMKEKVYSVVLMDLEMPVMGGLEATQRIRQYEKDRNIFPTYCQKIVGVTASTDSTIKEKALMLGMNEFVHKPFQLETMQGIFARLFV